MTDTPFLFAAATDRRPTAYWPTVTSWNRLEGRPRAEDFDRATRAEVRDALWMLSKQWQMGEFLHDDAGSPILAKLDIKTTALTKYRPGDAAAEAFEDDVPIEAKAEHRPIAFTQGGLDVALDIRLLMGRQWLKAVRRIDDTTLVGRYIDTYGIDRPVPTAPDQALLTAHLDVWQHVAAVAGRAMDGFALYEHLTENETNTAWDELPVVPGPTEQTALRLAAERFVKWFVRLFYQPVDGANPSWRPEYLEHQFATSAPDAGGERVFVADEYAQGHLDWYHLDVSPNSPLGEVAGDPLPDVEGRITRSIIPTTGSFGGMPEPRWWAFEDREVDLAFVKPDTPDLNKLLLAEFILVYANDWFVVPVTMPSGSIGDVRGLMVTNVFGERTWVEAAGAGRDEDWERFAMYTHAVRGDEDVAADTALVLLPAARKVLEANPLEEFHAVRDETANMVWAVESRVPLATGTSSPGRQAGYELREKLQALVDGGVPVEELPAAAPIRYRLVNSVPEEWIPFIPVHVDGDNREIQLQRAAMPRLLAGDPNVPRKIEPRTALLRTGLDEDTPSRYFLHEEEIPRSGITVHASFQRTRWYDGRVITWLGIRKRVGRGSGSSGLAFDQIVPVGHDPEG